MLQKHLHADFQTLAIYVPNFFFAQTGRHQEIDSQRPVLRTSQKNWTFRDTSSWACSRHQSYYLGVVFPAAANSFDILNVRKNYGSLTRVFGTNALWNI